MSTIEERALSGATARELQSMLLGPVIYPGHPAYEEARRVWNGLIDRRPALIAQCRGVADVMAAVAFARAHELLVAVRGGGHNVAGFATCDGGLVIDLSRMRGIHVDPESRRARVQPGVLWGELDRETQLFGLATPGGEVSITGVAGLTLSGGVGYLRRKHGLSSDNLVSVELVTADGQFVRASSEEHPDLFWALRGGGGNFGVVTSFEFQLHEVGPEVMAMTVAYPVAEAETVLRAWREFAETAPDEATTAAMLWSVPAVDEFPEALHGQEMVILDGMYAGPLDRGEAVFQPLRGLGAPLFDLSGPSTYLAVQSAMDWVVPDGRSYYWKAVNLQHLGDDCMGRILSWAERRPAPSDLVVLRHLGGAMARVPGEATAFGNRRAPFNLSIDAMWDDPSAESETSRANIEWARAFWKDMQVYSDGGVYLNFPGFGEEGEALTRAGLGDNYARLRSIKAKYDPTNLFRVNQNVRPSTAGDA
jgi:FAD/FMN-containing dehydrogenase